MEIKKETGSFLIELFVAQSPIAMCPCAHYHGLCDDEIVVMHSQ